MSVKFIFSKPVHQYRYISANTEPPEILLTQQIHLWWDASLKMQPASKTRHLTIIILSRLGFHGDLKPLFFFLLLLIVVFLYRVAAADRLPEADSGLAAACQRRRRLRGLVLPMGRGRRGRVPRHQVPGLNGQRGWEDGGAV